MRRFDFPWMTMIRDIAGGMFVLGAVAWGVVEHSQATIAADDPVKPVSTAIPSAGLPSAGSSAATKAVKVAKPTQGFTLEREAAALTFVRMHHAELAELLERLKTRRPQEYQKAIRELFRASERLALSQEQQPLRYELELQEWKLSSRIQLLAARMSMNRTPELEQELRQLLNEQVSVHRELIRFSYERTSARAAALQKELADLERRQADLVEERFQAALKSNGQNQKKQPAKTATAANRPESNKPESNKPDEKDAAKSRKPAQAAP